MGTFHFRVRPPEGNVERTPVSVQVPSRSGPRHCGQSLATACWADSTRPKSGAQAVRPRKATRRFRLRFGMVIWIRPLSVIMGVIPIAFDAEMTETLSRPRQRFFV